MHPCRGERRFALPSHPDLNRHPPLEGNDIGTACRAPTRSQRLVSHALYLRCASPQPFVRHAPTLGGECYAEIELTGTGWVRKFQWAPTLGGECYGTLANLFIMPVLRSFNGHPPLGVNATMSPRIVQLLERHNRFQWAPTLGGECYHVAAHCAAAGASQPVSMGTHPWG